MTGYAVLTRTLSGAAASVELKSVNGRFLDASFRLPEELRSSEPALRERVVARVRRGKLECRVSLAPAPGTGAVMSLNRPLLEALAGAQKAVRAALPDSRPLGVGEVLHWPGMLAEEQGAADAVRDFALLLFDETLEAFCASRRREGEKLGAIIGERVSAAQALLARIQPLMPEAIAAYQAKLCARLRDALGEAGEDRIRQEMSVFGVKFDVAEEISRLAVHLEEVRRTLAEGGVAGKRLDFLMQELNREANTLGSKSVSRELSDAVLEAKLLIEQMREQVQNIE